ncbi:hypothetical protein RIF29_17728 [Crotalaria pallida]|uniref:Uncharacterized protein n=1 Tax=Crotalaria pallida TaxID=3830 RepID=A0AAN9FNG7_CROPI
MCVYYQCSPPLCGLIMGENWLDGWKGGLSCIAPFSPNAYPLPCEMGSIAVGLACVEFPCPVQWRDQLGC